MQPTARRSRAPVCQSPMLCLRPLESCLDQGMQLGTILASSSRTNALAQQILWESLLVYHHKSFYWAAGITVTVDGINTSRVCRNPITTNQCTTNNQLPVVNSFDPSFSAVGILAGRLFSLHPFRRKIFQSFSESIQFFASVV